MATHLKVSKLSISIHPWKIEFDTLIFGHIWIKWWQSLKKMIHYNKVSQNYYVESAEND